MEMSSVLCAAAKSSLDFIVIAEHNRDSRVFTFYIQDLNFELLVCNLLA